jgi:hypothetical protein
MGLITNWASFAEDIILENSKEILHLPLTNSFDRLPYEIGIIFRPKKGKLGIIFLTKRFKEEHILKSNFPVAGVVSANFRLPIR